MSWKTYGEEKGSVYEAAFRLRDELNDVRETFFPVEPSDKSHRKEELAREGILLLDSIPAEYREQPFPRATYEYLRGEFLYVLLDKSREVEDHLTKAVELNPMLLDAWCSLGNYLRLNRDPETAKDRLNLALTKGPHKKIFHVLSMVQLQIALEKRSVEEAGKSIKHAQEAVSLDKTDGYSWYILGNAFLRRFTIFALDRSILEEAMKAYQIAERDEKMQSYPHLSFNSATVCRYLENYERALSGFEAIALKGAGLGAEGEVKSIVDLVDDIDLMLEAFNKSEGLASVAGPLNPFKVSSPYRNASVDSLQEGENRNVVLVGKVLHHIRREPKTPEYYILRDSDEMYYILTIYEASIGVDHDCGYILPDDQVMVLDPFYRDVDFSWKGKSYKFDSVRADFIEQLLVNGKPLKRVCNMSAAPVGALHEP